jgi:hypothetical protein
MGGSGEVRRARNDRVVKRRVESDTFIRSEQTAPFQSPISTLINPQMFMANDFIAILIRQSFLIEFAL